ncbi:hypothetical protein HPB50_007105 [Hyalomma asiaticum]|uniref:Uncharacterized protein n=1 Tax=Hyalomma asiaticum TaxID=266040 RepID=A0ACB7RSW3_HYAAI|nr:hypothetical protein HPB50_007105 [Hyalomma asiaticum]
MTAGFPEQLLSGLAEVILREPRRCSNTPQPFEQGGKSVVIPYLHGVSHRIKIPAARTSVNVAYSASTKLGSLCRKVNSSPASQQLCKKNHVACFVPCNVGVNYEVPTSCGSTYIGQTIVAVWTIVCVNILTLEPKQGAIWQYIVPSVVAPQTFTRRASEEKGRGSRGYHRLLEEPVASTETRPKGPRWEDCVSPEAVYYCWLQRQSPTTPVFVCSGHDSSAVARRRLHLENCHHALSRPRRQLTRPGSRVICHRWKAAAGLNL